MPKIDGFEHYWNHWQKFSSSIDHQANWSEAFYYGCIHGLNSDEVDVLVQMTTAYKSGLRMTGLLSKSPMEVADVD